MTTESSLPRTTRAIAALAAGPVDAADSFAEVRIDLPGPAPHDLLVRVRAVSVNPVDVKVRGSFPAGDAPKVLGFDAAGVVVATGSAVRAFEVGDEVYYAGSIARPGSNADHQLVDERITGHKPASLDFAQAAALPLTSLTAWETLFDHMGLAADSTGTLLVVGGAGGVASMVVQLARRLTRLTVVATASRPESADWVGSLGAHHVVHPRRLREEVPAVAPDGVNYVFTAFSAGQAALYAELMAVRGIVVAIDEPAGLDTLPLKSRSQAWHWEFMFARPLHDPASSYQREALDRVARLVDEGVLRTTLTRRLSPLTAQNMREAHRAVEGSGMVGKVVVAAE